MDPSGFFATDFDVEENARVVLAGNVVGIAILNKKCRVLPPADVIIICVFVFIFLLLRKLSVKKEQTVIAPYVASIDGGREGRAKRYHKVHEHLDLFFLRSFG